MFEWATVPDAGRRPGRTRLWDGLLQPRTPMEPDPPTDLVAELLDHLFHPVRGMRRQLARGACWRDAPWPLWAALAAIAVVGTLCYGATAALVLPLGGPAGVGLVLVLATGAGWLLFGAVLVALTGRPASHLAHACLVTMWVGEAILEFGLAGNLALWLLAPDAAGVALGFNIAALGLANLAMAAALAAQLGAMRVRPALALALWFGILNPAALAVLRLLRPDLLPL